MLNNKYLHCSLPTCSSSRTYLLTCMNQPACMIYILLCLRHVPTSCLRHVRTFLSASCTYFPAYVRAFSWQVLYSIHGMMVREACTVHFTVIGEGTQFEPLYYSLVAYLVSTVAFELNSLPVRYVTGQQRVSL